MSKLEIKKLFEFRKGRYLPCGLNLIERLWWKFMPGIIINVKWPVGMVTVDHTMPGWDWSLGATLQEFYTSDPNDHYRPWLEEHIGQQGWDWNWGIAGDDVVENRLTIKIRQKYKEDAIIAKLRWE